jgi:hypothetical protein
MYLGLIEGTLLWRRVKMHSGLFHSKGKATPVGILEIYYIVPGNVLLLLNHPGS